MTHSAFEFSYKATGFLAYMLIEHGLGKTRHGSFIGLVLNVGASIIKRSSNNKQTGEELK